MFYRGRVSAKLGVGLFVVLLFLTGCGEGGSGPQQAGGHPVHDLNLSVALQHSDVRGRLFQGEVGPDLQFASVSAELQGDGNEVYSASTSVEAGAEEARLGISGVRTGQYELTLSGFNASGAQIAEARTTLEVGLGGSTTVTLLLVAQPQGPLPPIARNLTYTAVPGEQLSVPAASGVLSNDTTVGGTAALVTSTQQGELDLQADGSFTYLPSPDAAGSDSFVYRLTDPNGSDEATVTFLFGPFGDGLFVQAGAAGTGESPDSPRPDLDGAVADSQPGDRIFLLYSPDPLEPTLGERVLNLPDQLSIVGVPQGTNPRETLAQTAGELPEVRFQFRPGNGNVFETFRAVAAEDEAVCFDLTERENATFFGMEIESPGLKIRLDDFVGELSIVESRIGGAVPEQLSSTIPGTGDIVGTLNAGSTTISVLESTIQGATFEIVARNTNVLRATFEDCAIAGNFRILAENGGRADLSVLGGEMVQLEAEPVAILGNVLYEHSNGGQGDLTVSGVSAEEARGIRVRAFEMPPDIGGRILVECIEYQDNGSFLDARFEGGEYELLALSNSVQEVSVINVSHIYLQVFQGAVLRSLLRDNEMPFGHAFNNSGGTIQAGLYDNVFGLADQNSAGPDGNPGGFTTAEIRSIRSFVSGDATPGQGNRAEFLQNRVGPVGDLGSIEVVHFNTSSGFFEIENLSQVELDNTIEEFVTSGTITEALDPLDLPDDPGDC